MRWGRGEERRQGGGEDEGDDEQPWRDAGMTEEEYWEGKYADG